MAEDSEHPVPCVLRVGLRGGEWVEVLKLQTKPARAGEEPSWEDPRGDEVIVGSGAASLTDGEAVSEAADKK